ncbi:addiction module toxin RelE [Salinicoccus hispanicus]|uniref:Addiction module toxin RelE n=2 Tax=Salinicoccus hispanicus TaxID=157225 RepID=A0A6N8U1Q2_9STAP|nr:addiction module toxin RelE [Salinicoccus hispanicus]MXQ51994.1 addiction module toxin RelE [Salinicoccus hispanicus]
MREVYFWEEAQKDYKKLDGTMKKWVDAAEERLALRGSEIGKDLGNTHYSKLAGFKELKNQKIGIRLIFKASSEGNIEIIEIVAIGKREDEKIFHTAERRRKNHL